MARGRTYSNTLDLTVLRTVPTLAFVGTGMRLRGDVMRTEHNMAGIGTFLNSRLMLAQHKLYYYF